MRGSLPRYTVSALVIAVGCSTPPRAAVTTVAACQALGRTTPAAPSLIGDSVPLPDDIDPRNAVAITASTVATFDQNDGRVLALDHTGRPRWTYGRSGDGPGEIARPYSARIIGLVGAQWIAADGARVLIFDGQTFFVFSEDGALLHRWSADSLTAERGGVTRRLRLSGERAYLDLQHLAPRHRATSGSATQRWFEVFEIDSSSARLIARLALPALPISPAGGVADGLAEAKPQWDLQQRCLVLSDGHSSHLVFVDLDGGARDTVDIGLPDWFVDVASANEQTQGLTPSGSAMPEPSARARIADLTLAADGMVWLRPSAQSARSATGQIVWRYDLHTGVLTQDTVVAFPRYADQASGVYAVTSDSNGFTVLRRSRSDRGAPSRYPEQP